MNKYYMIPNTKELNKFNENIILPLENYSIGFDRYFCVREIKDISESREVSVIINKLLHKSDIENIKPILSKLKNVKYFFISDLGLINLIDKDKIILHQSHIISNYDSINYYNELGIRNIVVSNELTIDELKNIRKNTTSELFYFLINHNDLMYSKRKLISSYNVYKGTDHSKNNKITEHVSKKELLIREEGNSCMIFDSLIFSANDSLDEFDNFNFIINFSHMNEEETQIILNHYKEKNLSDYLNVENYFLHNKIGYKVGDINWQKY